MCDKASFKTLSSLILILLTTTIILPYIVYSNVDSHIIIANKQVIKPTTSYKVLLVGIEDYPPPYSSLMYTIDAMEVIKEELLDGNNYADGTTLYNDQARPKQFWSQYIGGEDYINNFEYVFFAGHGNVTTLFFSQYDRTNYYNGSKVVFDEVLGRPIVYSHRVKWFMLYACHVLNLSSNKFETIVYYLFYKNGQKTNDYLHGVLGASSSLFDRYIRYNYESKILSDKSSNTSIIIPAIKYTAEKFSQYIQQGYNLKDAWYKSIKDTQTFREIGFYPGPASVYVILDVTMLDPFTGQTYHITYDYSTEHFPGYGNVYSDPYVLINNPFTINYSLEVIYDDNGTIIYTY